VPVRRCKHKKIEAAHSHDPDRLSRDGGIAKLLFTGEPRIKLREKIVEARKEFVLSAHATQFSCAAINRSPYRNKTSSCKKAQNLGAVASVPVY
jgi:hypothetical protein